MTNNNKTLFKPTLDTVITTDDSILMSMIKKAVNTYIDESGLSKTDMERFVTDYVSFDNGFLKASGPAFQMKVMAEAVESYIYDNNIQNETLEKFIFKLQKAYRQIYDLPTLKYSSKHLQICGTDYKTFSCPIVWNEMVNVVPDIDQVSNILDMKTVPDNLSFLVSTANYADIEVESLSPQLALKEAVQMANNDPYEYIGDANIQRLVTDQVPTTGELIFDESPTQIEYPSSISEEDMNFIDNHPKLNTLLISVNNEALEIRNEDVSAGQIGDANPDITIIEESVDYNFEVQQQVSRTNPFIFIDFKITPSEINKIFNIDSKDKSIFNVGFSGVISNDSSDSSKTWKIEASNFNELMEIKAKINYFLIDRAHDLGNLETIYGTDTCPYSIYKAYVSNTGRDPLEKHPDIMEKYHFPPKFASDYKPNSLETLLNSAKSNEALVLKEMDEALAEFSDGTGKTVDELLQDGDIVDTLQIRNKYNFYQGKLSAFETIFILLSTNDFENTAKVISETLNKTEQPYSFQRNQTGFEGEIEIYKSFMAELDELKLSNNNTTNKNINNGA